MKKKMYQDIADKAARVATERLHENLQGIAREIARDQSNWLDKVMKDILPPRLYEAAQRGDLMEETEAHLKKHGFKLVFIPDNMRIRVMKHDQVHAEFVPQLVMDDVPIEMTPSPLGNPGLN